ncbi:MAG: nucleotide exchange factor GrpE [Planctomycetes bacterium]|nr:nucleotide exchange factor GrpE [Planctomycetota bacterium]
MTQSAPRRLRELLEAEFAARPWWRRWLERGWQRHVRERCGDALARTNEEEFATLMQGYSLIQSRIETTLRQNGIRRIDCTGRRVDPARMTVVELVDDRRAEPETVIEEVRPGYVWGETVVRYAEVRAVASRRAEDAARPHDDEALASPAANERN